MKKVIIRIGIALGALLLIALLVGFFSLNGIVKKGVETAGPQVTKVDTKLGSAKILPFNGAGQLSGLTFGNPPGYKTASSIQVGDAKLDINVRSLLSDKIVIEEVYVDKPEITLEGTINGKNNLSDILKNIEEFTATEEKEPTASGTSKKLQINRFVLKGAKLNISVNLSVLGGRTLSVVMPDLEMTDLGTGENGITVGELSKKLFRFIFDNVHKVAKDAIANATKEITGAVQGISKEGVEGAKKATEGVRDIFKRNK